MLLEEDKLSKLTSFRLTILAVAVLVSDPLFTATARAQRDLVGPRLDLSFAAQTPGSEVSLVLYLSVPPDVKIGTAISKITFPNRVLSFQRVVKGLSSELVNAEVTAVVNVDSDNLQNSVVTVAVSSRERKAIPGGAVADLRFKIYERTQTGQTIRLKNVITALTTDDPPKPVKPIMGENGEIRVTATVPSPVFSCFFYMH
ncbi:MAG: hypothetical protein HY644_03670 [Acidobacteria bacterium]|nr:hypothetical protein [Acidobacteriota bacterium]